MKKNADIPVASGAGLRQAAAKRRESPPFGIWRAADNRQDAGRGLLAGVDRSESDHVCSVDADERLEPARVVERAPGRQGELALRVVGEHFEIISNGVFLMDTRNGESERLLVRLALRGRRNRLRLLIGGLGVGFSLAEALRSDLVERVTVVEIEPKIVEWRRTWLAPFSGQALADPRVQIVVEDVVAFLDQEGERFDGICLDVDNGPAWTVAPANARLYTDERLALLYERLRPGGVLTIWSAAEVEGFAERLRRVFDSVDVVAVPVRRGEPDVIYVASRL